MKRKSLPGGISAFLPFICFALFLFAACSDEGGSSGGSGNGGGGNTPLGKGNVMGTVVDKYGDPIAAATVEISSDPVSVTADLYGQFTATNVDEGSHTLEVFVDNVNYYSGQCHVTANSTTDLKEIMTNYELPDNVLLLDGVDDRVEANSQIYPTLDKSQSFTVEAWIYPTDVDKWIMTEDALDIALVSQAGAANGGLGIMLHAWDDTCSGINGLTTFRDVKLNQWNHVAAIYDASASQFNIAINGNLGDPFDFTGSGFCYDNSYLFTVGGVFESDTDIFQGDIDEIRVSSTVRYNSNFTPEYYFTSDASTLGLWHFNEPIGYMDFADSSSNFNTLTGVNGAQTQMLTTVSH